MKRQQQNLPFFRTKLNRPPVAADLVCRPRLLDALDKGIRMPLSLVSAPAGYGKSMLVSHWVESRTEQCAWLSLDEEDSGMVVFLAHLLAAVRTRFPDFGARTESLLRAHTRTPMKTLSQSLSNDLEDIETRFVLVLDDYHKLGGTQVQELLGHLLKHPPKPLHLVISTRRDPRLPLTALRALGQLTEVRTRDLMFTALEAAASLKAQGFSLGQAALARLQELVEGWGVGLRLVGLTLRHQDDPDQFLSSLQGDIRSVQDYLLDQVLSRQPSVVQDWLIKTSLLDRFCGGLCEHVCLGNGDRVPSGFNGEAF
ncbi:MAG: AAA family ATPase, partial [Acidobacteriota bacterium]